MQIPLLIIGTAFDGPVGIPVKPSSIEEAFEIFGAYGYQQLYVSATDTTVTIPDTGAKTVEFFVYNEGLLVPFTNITLTSVEDGVVTIEPLGVDAGIIVKWLRTLPEGSTAVYRAYAEAITAVPDATIYLMRAGGTTASITIGSEPNTITLESEYPGALYNCYIDSSGGDFTIFQPIHKGLPLRYVLDMLATAEKLATDINLDYMRGKSVFRATSTHGEGYFSLSPGGYEIAGGTDGALSDEGVLDHLDQLDLRGVKVVHIAGLLYSSDQQISPDDVDDYLTEERLTDSPYPTMYVQGVAYTADDMENLPSSYAQQLYFSAKRTPRLNVTMVVGQAQYAYYPVDPYWSSATPAYAALLSKSESSCLWGKLGLLGSRPYFTEFDIDWIKKAGMASLTYSLSRGWVVACDTTTNADWPASRYLAYLAIVDVTYPILEPLVGGRISDKLNLEDLLTRAISSLSSIKSSEVTVYYPNSQNIVIEITAQPYGAVGAIKFGVSLNAITG